MPDTIYAIMRQRRNTFTYFQTHNITLEDGQIGIINSGRYRHCFKVGDGVTPWNNLPWVTDYAILFNKPSINGVTLTGNHTIAEIGAAAVGDLAAEITARQNADTALSAAIQAEATVRQSADNALSADIQAEASARQNADNTHAALTTAHGSTQTPAGARIAMYGAEGGLKSNKVPAQSNDVIRKTELDTETQARTNADNSLQANKLDKKPDGTNPLIGGDYKLNPQYLPAAITGALVYGGTFSSAGIINASSYAPALQGVPIANVNTGQYPGFYFISQGAYTFSGNDYITGDWAISQGNHSPAWVKIDNGNVVSSVNGKTGAVVLIKADVGLGNVDNTSDMAKPVSTAQQAAIQAEAGIRQSADNALSADIQAEATARQNADTALSAAIQAEASARQSADNDHAALTTVHGSTPTPAGMRIAMYGAESGLKSDKMPAQSNDVIRKTEMDAEETSAKGVEGALNDLTTTDKTNLVAAINELNGELDSFPAIIRTLSGDYNIGNLAGAYITALQ